MNYCLVDCLNVTPVQSFLGFLFYLHYVCLCSERLKLSLDYANTLKLQIVAPFCTIITASFQDYPRTQQNCHKRACFTMSVQKEDIYSRVTRIKYTLRMYRSDTFQNHQDRGSQNAHEVRFSQVIRKARCARMQCRFDEFNKVSRRSLSSLHIKNSKKVTAQTESRMVKCSTQSDDNLTYQKQRSDWLFRHFGFDFCRRFCSRCQCNCIFKLFETVELYTFLCGSVHSYVVTG